MARRRNDHRPPTKDVERSSLVHHPSPIEPRVVPYPELRIFALGPARVERGKHVLTSADWTYTKARKLFFYLLCHSSATKEQIGLALWLETSPTQLRNSFRVTLYHLRRALGQLDWIIFENDHYTFYNQAKAICSSCKHGPVITYRRFARLLLR